VSGYPPPGADDSGWNYSDGIKRVQPDKVRIVSTVTGKLVKPEDYKIIKTTGQDVNHV